MLEISTFLTYLGLLGGAIFLLATKRKTFQTMNGELLGTYNKIQAQDLFVLILFTLVVGFRFDVGVDWAAYKAYFEELSLYKNISLLDERMEIGYVSLNAFVDFIGGNYTLLFAVTALISWYFILKSFPTKLLPLTFFFIFCDGYFFWSMNGVRQFMAIAIFAYAIKYILKENFKNYLICIVFAALFHKSVLLLIPLYFVPYHKLYHQKFWIIAFIMSFLFSRSPLILNTFQHIFASFSEYVPIMAGYTNYFDSQNYQAGHMDGTGLGYIFRIIITFLLLFFSKRVIERYPETRVYFILFFTGIIVFNLFFMFQIVGRFLHYFIFFRAYLLACLVFYLFPTRKYSYIGVGISISYFLLFLTDIFNSANQCCPYQFSF